MTEQETPRIAGQSMAQRTIYELEAAGWPSVAADVRDGLSGQTICARLREMGEDQSDAYSIVSYWLCS